MDNYIISLFPIWLIIFVIASSFHEFSHAFMAYKLGDDTAQQAGRLTLNPIAHIDPVGLIVLIVTIVSSQGTWGFGWAKPVPFNPWRMKNPKMGMGLVGLAGPVSNLILVSVASLLIKAFEPQVVASLGISRFFAIFILMNVVLAAFNLIPIPPLDGSKVLFSVLPYKMLHILDKLERYSPIIFILLIITPPGKYVIDLFIGTIFTTVIRVFSLPVAVFASLGS